MSASASSRGAFQLDIQVADHGQCAKVNLQVRELAAVFVCHSFPVVRGKYKE